MSHTNQTPNYHLPQFIGTDKPAWLVDFNQAMSDIDTQMKANETASGTAEADAQSALSGVTALNSQVGGIQTSVTALETQAPLDEAQIETNRQNIATNAQNIVGIDNRLGHVDISGVGSSVTDAIANEDTKVGNLADLDTTDKSSIVNAINEAVAGGGDTATVRYDEATGYVQLKDSNGWFNWKPASRTPINKIPIMTSDTAPEGACTSSGSYGGAAYQAFDGNQNTSWSPAAGTGDNTGTGWLQYAFADEVNVNQLQIITNLASGDTFVPYTALLSYSEDGLNFTNIANIAVNSASFTYDLPATLNMRALKLTMNSRNVLTSANYYYMRISEFKAFGN